MSGDNKNDSPLSTNNDVMNRSVVIAEIPTDIDEDTLETCLEARKRGGGEIEKLEYDRQNGCASVTFKNIEVSQRLRNAGLYQLTPKRSVRVLPSVDEHVLYVTDIHPDIAEYLEDFLENRKYGGGEVAEFDLDVTTQSARVKFEDRNVAADLLKRSSMEIRKRKVLFSKYQPQSQGSSPASASSSSFGDALEDEGDEDDEEDGIDLDLMARTIVFVGVSKDMTDVLETCLENKRKGGGPIEKIDPYMQDGTLVTFEESQVAQNFLKASTYKLGPDFFDVRAASKSDFFPAEKGTNIDRRASSASSNSSFTDIPHNMTENQTSSKKSSFLTGASKKDTAQCEKVPEHPLPPSTTVWVLNIPSSVKEETLRMFLENKKRSGGGNIRTMKLEPDNKRAVVEFESQQVAEEMIKKGTVTMLDGKPLQICRPRQTAGDSIKKTPQGAKPKHEADAHLTRNLPCSRESRTVEITGLTKEVTSDNLQLYLENKKRSSGGDIQTFNRLSSKSAILTFKSAQDAQNFASKSDHSFCGTKLTVALLDSWPDIKPCAIKLTGFKATTTKDNIMMFVESRYVAAGFDLEDFLHDEELHIVVVTFSTPSDAAKVIERCMKSTLTLDGTPIHCEVLHPARPPQLPTSDDLDPDALLFTEVTSLSGGPVKPQAFKDFAEKAGVAKVKKIMYMPRPGTVLVQYTKAPDYEKAREIVCSKPCQGKMVCVQRIPCASAIQVHNLDSVSKEMLTFYFENTKRSGGGDIENVEVTGDPAYAIVEFKDQRTIQNVLSQEHELGGKKLSVGPFIECLGITPPGFDTSKPLQSLPPDIVLESIPDVLAFVYDCPKLKAKIEQELNRKHCFVTWPTNCKEKIVLKCTVPPGHKDAYAIIKNWTNQCETYARAELGNIVCETMDILQEIWKDFDKRAKDCNWPSSTDSTVQVKIDYDKNEHRVCIRGPKQDVEERKVKLSQIRDTLEEKLRESKKEIKDTQALKPEKLALLKSFPAVMPSSCRLVRFNFIEKGIEYTGQAEAVTKAKRDVLALLTTLDEKYVPNSSSGMCAFLRKPEVIKHLNECFNDSSVPAVYVITNNDIKVFSLSGTQTDAATKIIQSEISEKAIDMDEARNKCWQSNGGQHLLEKLRQKYKNFEVGVDKSTLTLTAFKDDFKEILIEIEKFLNENAMVERFIQMKTGKVEMLEKYLRTELDQIKRDLKDHQVDLSLNRGQGRTGCQISGNSRGLDDAEKKINSLIGRIKTTEHAVDPNLVRLLLKEQSRHTVSVIADKHKAVIKYSDEEQGDPGAEVGRGKRRHLVDPYVHTHLILPSGKGKIIKLVVGDITKHQVDVIVNAANEKLEHYSGVARAILEAGGQSIQEECRKRVKDRGNLSHKEVFVSMAGNLPCKAVVHTVGPIWHGGSQNEERDLDDAVSAALNESSRRSFKTVSMPFISTGIFKFPKDTAAKVILKSICDHLRHPNSSLMEVHIVCGTADDLAKFTDSTKTLKDVKIEVPRRTPKTQDEEESVCSNLGSKGTSNSEVDDERGGSGGQRERQGHSGGSDARPQSSFKTAEGIKITLVKGSIAEQDADVIVSTTGKNFDLSKGAVSQSLLSAAGKELQDECNKKYGGHLGQDIAVTGGYQLKCKDVYHATCSKWQDGSHSSKQVVRSIVSKSMSLASNNRHSSIAFPTIGCGKLNYPHDVVANLMFEEILHFSSANNRTSLRDVRIVIYDKDFEIIRVFENQLGFLAGGNGGTSARSVSSEGRNSYRDDHGSSVDKCDKIECDVGNCKFIVKLGDITQEQCDAIVNSTNDKLNMDFGALSKAIVRAAGRTIVDECRQIGTVDRNGLAVTSAGNLPCSRIIHVASVRNSSDWKGVIENCLREAESKNISTIVLPPLGTGHRNASVSDLAGVMIKTIIRFCESKPRTLRTITIVIREPSMLSEFVDVLQRELGSAGKHLGKELAEKFKNFFLSGSSGRGDHRGARSPARYDGGGVHKTPAIAGRAYASQSSPLTLTIYAMKEKDIEDAITDIQNMNQEKIINGPKFRDFITNLSSSQQQEIKQLGTKHGIRVDIDPNTLNPEIRLNGDYEGITRAHQDIVDLYLDMKSSTYERRELEMIGKTANWQYEEGAKFHSFDLKTRGTIEKAYAANQQTVDVKTSRKTYRITFSSMTEELVGQPGTKFKVRRYEGKIPKGWSPIPSGQEWTSVTLNPTDPEYQKVFANLAQPTLKIVKIERIQNPKLFQVYKSYKQSMDELNPPSTTHSNERRLWHGTAGTSVADINGRNFNRSYCGQHGVAIGNGVYFAVGSSYSISGYCPPDTSGIKHIYQARVLTGKFTQGAGGMKDAPAPFDSVTDNVQTPGMFVVFKDFQTYPEYHISFQ